MAAARVAVVGGGWAGLAAAVEATQLGAEVALFEMAPQLGGRARRVDVDGLGLDNGQHILIGAYSETLRLMRSVGVDLQSAFVRTPLRLAAADGTGLFLPEGPATLAFVRGVLARQGWSPGERLALLKTAAGWGLRGFRCAPNATVADLTGHLPRALLDDLVDPLCVAALNTPARHASAGVFLRVMRDALFSGPGSADLLLPRVRLSELLPEPAREWLQASGSSRVESSRRIDRIERQAKAWLVDGEHFDGVVLAASAVESARLARDTDPAWADTAASLRYEPIVTLYAQSDGTRLPHPMLALASDESSRPAQFVFDHGQLGGPPGRLAFVISGAAPWLERGSDQTILATLSQAAAAMSGLIRAPLRAVKLLTEKRATFRCTPGLNRPAGRIAPGLHAAGDYVAGPYPATLEGAVRSGVQAARSLIDEQTAPPAARR